MQHSRAIYAQRNLWLYPIQKIFNKRVFLPIVPIYFTEYVGFSIPQLGLLAAILALIMLVLSVPTGYYADRFGRVQALRIGALLLTVSTVLYAGFPTKTGIVIGVILEASGFAFIGGAGQSLVHDSLDVLDRKKDYSKVLSRAQSLALVLNAVFIALVPLTYAFDPRLPFLIGTVAFIALLATTFAMRDVEHHRAKPMQWRGFRAIERLSGNITMLLAIVFFGIIGAAYFSFDIVAIGLRELGLEPAFLGWVFASASLIGAVMGLFIHKLKQLSLSVYMLIDVAVLIALFAAGYSGNVWLLAAMAMLSISFWRYRRIIYQDHLLTRFTTGYKSTLISVMVTTESLAALWVPIATTGAVGALGVVKGFGLLTFAVTVIGIVYIGLMLYVFVRPSSQHA